MPKIAIVFDDGLDRADGVQQQIRLIGTWLKTQKYQVRYLVGETKSKEIDGQKVYSLGKNFKISANKNQLTLPRPVEKELISNIFDAEKFDLVYVMLPCSPFLGARVVSEALARDIPIVGTFHTLPATTIQKAGSWVYGMYLKPKLDRFKTITAVSKPTKKYIKKYFMQSSQLIPNMIDLKPYKKTIKKPNNLKTIIYMNRLVARKGPEHLLKALEVLNQRSQLNGVTVKICGKGPLKKKLQIQIVEFGLSDKVELLGFIDEKEKPKLLAEADLAVYPSTGGEAFGIVLLEAMSAKTVVLGGNNPGYRSVIGAGHPSQIVNPRDHQQFAQNINILLNDQEAIKTAKKFQNQHLKQYDIEIAGKDLLSVFNSAIKK